jgi:hypothetical protein
VPEGAPDWLGAGLRLECVVLDDGEGEGDPLGGGDAGGLELLGGVGLVFVGCGVGLG